MGLNLSFYTELSMFAVRKIWSVLLLFGMCISALGQNKGDFRSLASGNWETSSTWQVCTQVNPTVVWTTLTAGFPGGTGANAPQVLPSGATSTPTVTIQAGHTVSFPNPTGSQAIPTSYSFGDLIVNGTLNIGANTNGNWYVSFPTTSHVLLSQGSIWLLSANGDSELHLPSGAAVVIVNGGKISGVVCNANKVLYIGSVKYAACTGGAYQNFGDMNTSGGSLLSKPISNPQAICVNNGSATISSANTASEVDSYSWTLPPAGGWSGPTNQTTSNNLGTFTFSQPGNYKFTLKVTKTVKIGGTNYTMSDTESVVVSVGQTNTVTPSTSPVVCLGTPMPNITHTTTVANGINQPGVPGANNLPPGVVAYWAQNTITISGTPTSVGSWTYSIPLTGGCGSVNAVGTIIVTATSTVSAASSSPILCVNTAMSNITHSTTGVSGIGTPTGLPSGVTAAWAGNTITISGTPTASGIFNYSIPLTGGCGTVNATGTITVTAANTVTASSSAPTLCINTAMTKVTHTTTGATGIGTPTGLPSGVTAAWAGNTITISGTPTASGIFNYSIPLTGGCGTVNATGTITVTAANTVTAASLAPTLCINTMMTSITHTTTGATGIGTTTTNYGLPAGVTAALSGNTITISGTPTASGIFNYSISLTGGCGTVNATGTITVNSLPTASVSTANNRVCANENAVFTITGPAGATVQYNINGGSAVPIVLNGSGIANVTIPNASSTQTLNIISVNNGICMGTGNSATVTIGATSTFDGTTWSAGLPNNNGLSAIIDADYATLNGSFSACSCTVNVGNTLTISPNTYLNVTNNIQNNGSIILESDGNLIQANPNGTFAGNNITAKRAVTDMDNVLATQMDYVYWSSPVSGQNLQQFSPGTPANRIYQYNEWNDYFSPVPLATEPNFVPGKGYAIRAEVDALHPPNPIGYNKTYTFVGKPNNGDISINVKRSANTGTVVHGYNLVGNPYPSNIDFNVLYGNNSALIYNTAWFWTNSSYQMYMNGSSYSGNNYAVYNGTGGNNASYSLGTPAPNGIVKVGQGFIVQVRKPVGTNEALNFKNSYGNNPLRTTASGTFYQRNAGGKDRFWLKLTAPSDVVNSLLIGYIQDATNGFEQDYDTEAFEMSSDLFYSKLSSKNLLIQGRGAFNDTDVIPLGANFFSSGNYTIELENGEGIFAGGQEIYLKDHLNGTLTSLTNSGYTFATNKGISEGRFEIVYSPSYNFLSTIDKVKEGLVVYRDGDNFVVKSKADKITRLELYEGSGKLIYKSEPYNMQALINAQYLNNGVYILRIDQNGRITDKKLIK